MKLSYEDTKMLETPSGGFTAASLAVLGIEWPPQTGWRERLVGQDVPEHLFLKAIEFSEAPKAGKLERKKRLAQAKAIHAGETLPEQGNFF
jgi:hypothetical protein